MTSVSLSQLLSIGHRVDPIILEALAGTPAGQFRPALEYQFKAGGKRVRPALVMLSCAASGGSLEDALRPAAAVELIHNYSLVMDDLIDHGEVRRGKPTVRVLLGDSVSLLVAMFYREIIDDLIRGCPRSEKIREIAVHVMKEIIDGERLDLLLEQAGREDPYITSNRISNPSFGLYLEMIGKKTASLFRAASQIGAHSAKTSSKVVRNLGLFGWKAGLAFQVMDDVLDVCGKRTGKQEAKDVVEHKLGNAALLVAIRFLSPRKKTKLLKILRTDRVTPQMASRARRLVGETPAEFECREIAKNYLGEAKQHLSVLEESESKDSLIRLADAFVVRSY